MLKNIKKTEFADCTLSTPRECLVLRLGSQEYAVDFEVVQELRADDGLMPVADMPAYVRGVVNVRGLVIPVVDLRIKFQCEDDAASGGAIVAVLHVDDCLLGLLIDEAIDVVKLEGASFQPVPRGMWRGAARYLRCMAVQGQRRLPLIDIRRLLAYPELRRLGTQHH